MCCVRGRVKGGYIRRKMIGGGDTSVCEGPEIASECDQKIKSNVERMVVK